MLIGANPSFMSVAAPTRDTVPVTYVGGQHRHCRVAFAQPLSSHQNPRQRPTLNTIVTAASSSGPASPRNSDEEYARMQGARVTQQRSTDLIARLLEASDPVGVARQHVEGLNEEFFMTGSAYLTLARKDGNSEVAGRLERALTAAWGVKQSTLRPELQLLNTLVRTEVEAERKEVYLSGGSDLVSTLLMNDRWFASTLGRMTADVERQPPNPGKAQLLARLRAIQRETEALERQAARQQQP